jgi:hypothetical protein
LVYIERHCFKKKKRRRKEGRKERKEGQKEIFYNILEIATFLKKITEDSMGKRKEKQTFYEVKQIQLSENNINNNFGTTKDKINELKRLENDWKKTFATYVREK